jgi:hypothetical protein
MRIFSQSALLLIWGPDYTWRLTYCPIMLGPVNTHFGLTRIGVEVVGIFSSLGLVVGDGKKCQQKVGNEGIGENSSEYCQQESGNEKL